MSCQKSKEGFYMKIGISKFSRNTIYENIKQKKVLIVEDYLPSMLSIQKLLFDLGFRNTLLANNGEKAKSIFSSEVSLILLDSGLPDISSLELCNSFKNHSPSNPISIIGMALKEEFKDICLKAGMDAFLTKPFSSENFLDAISSCFINSKNKTSAILN
jgi:CheY-like chemotaxis protein